MTSTRRRRVRVERLLGSDAARLTIDSIHFDLRPEDVVALAEDVMRVLTSRAEEQSQ